MSLCGRSPPHMSAIRRQCSPGPDRSCHSPIQQHRALRSHRANSYEPPMSRHGASSPIPAPRLSVPQCSPNGDGLRARPPPTWKGVCSDAMMNGHASHAASQPTLLKMSPHARSHAHIGETSPTSQQGQFPGLVGASERHHQGSAMAPTNQQPQGSLSLHQMHVGGAYSARGVVPGTNFSSPFLGNMSALSFQTQLSSDSTNHTVEEMMENISIHKQASQLQKENKELKERMQLLEMDRNRLTEEKCHWAAQNRNLLIENHSLQDENCALQEKMEQKNVEWRDVVENYKQCQERIFEERLLKEKEVTEQARQLEEKETALQFKNKLLLEKSSVLQELREFNGQKISENEELQRQLSQVTTKLEQASHLCTARQDQIAEKDAEIADLEEQVDRHREMIQEFKASQSSKDQVTTELNAKVLELENIKASEASKVSEMQVNLKSLSDELIMARQERDNALVANEANKENTYYNHSQTNVNMVLGMSKDSMNDNQSVDEFTMQETIILDIGSSFCKVGFAGKQEPCAVFPTVVGRPKRRVTMPVGQERQLLIAVGEDARRARDRVNLGYPMLRGVVQDWQDMERIWKHIFYNKLLIDPQEHPVLLTEPPMNPKAHREKIVQSLFDESVKVPLVAIELQAVLSLYAVGLLTGLVLDSGDGVSYIVPVWEGYGCNHQITRMHFAGKRLTEHMVMMLSDRGYKFKSPQPTAEEMDVVRELKEKLCYVAADYDKELIQAHESPQEFEESYELLNGAVVKVGAERFKCPEALFRCEVVGEEWVSWPTVLMQTIQKCGIDIRKQLWESVVLTGGNTLFRGLQERLQEELKQLAPPAMRVRVIAPENRQHTVFHGGSIYAPLIGKGVGKDKNKDWISRQEFQEKGPEIVHRTMKSLAFD